MREKKRGSRVDGDERDRREKLMNNLKRERTLFKNEESARMKSGENALNIGAASRSNRIHSILFCLFSKEQLGRKGRIS